MLIRTTTAAPVKTGRRLVAHRVVVAMAVADRDGANSLEGRD